MIVLAKSYRDAEKKAVEINMKQFKVLTVFFISGRRILNDEWPPYNGGER